MPPLTGFPRPLRLSPIWTGWPRSTPALGTWTFVAIVRVAEHEQLADLVAGRLSKIHGVLGTDTHIAFRSYSRRDIEATFSLGLNG